MPDNDTIVAKIPKDTRKVRGTRVRSLHLTASVPPEDALPAAAAPAPGLRLHHGAVHVHSLGARVLAEFGSDHDIPVAILDRVAEYSRRLPRVMVHLVGADRFLHCARCRRRLRIVSLV
jgi:hypothetical protein